MNPSLLSIGSSGPAVKLLQLLLNVHPPSTLPPLAEDGIFGPKTHARVKEYQSKNQLQPDGIAGPKTNGALRKLPPAPPREFLCGTGDPANAGIGSGIAQQFASEAKRSGFVPTATSSSSFVGVGAPALPLALLPSFKKLSGPQETTAIGVYGSSLDFSRIFMTDKKGPTGRPFTMAANVPLMGVVQIMNLGTFSPGKKLLIHELAHCWQSQHHTDFAAFMPNALTSQAMAAAANAPFAGDSTVNTHKDFPVHFPFSAYAYLPGKKFEEYAAEQIAEQIEDGKSAIIAHAKGVAKNAPDGANMISLSVPRIENRFNPLVET